MSKREIRLKIYGDMWMELRPEYLAMSFMVGLATGSILQDITVALSIGSVVQEVPTKYVVAAAVTAGNAIGMAIRQRKRETSRS